MSRQVKDAREITTGDLIYFRGHAKATYMSNGQTVEDALANAGIPDAPSDDIVYSRKNGEWVAGISDAPSDNTIYGRKNGEWVDINQESEPIGTIKAFYMLNPGDKYAACDGSLLSLEDYPDLQTNYPKVPYVSLAEYSTVSNVYDIKYINNKILMSLSGKIVAIDSNGNKQEYSISSAAYSYINQIYYKNGVYCGVASNYNIVYSRNLTSWTSAIQNTSGNTNLYLINNQFVVITDLSDNSMLYTSNNGTTWSSYNLSTLLYNAGGSSDYISYTYLVYYNSKYLLFEYGNNVYYESSNLTSWTIKSLEFISYLTDIVVCKDKLYILADDGIVYTLDKNGVFTKSFYLTPPEELMGSTGQGYSYAYVKENNIIYYSSSFPNAIYNVDNNTITYDYSSNSYDWPVFEDTLYTNPLYIYNTDDYMCYEIDNTKYQLPDSGELGFYYIKVRK